MGTSENVNFKKIYKSQSKVAERSDIDRTDIN